MFFDNVVKFILKNVVEKKFSLREFIYLTIKWITLLSKINFFCLEILKEKGNHHHHRHHQDISLSISKSSSDALTEWLYVYRQYVYNAK